MKLSASKVEVSIAILRGFITKLKIGQKLQCSARLHGCEDFSVTVTFINVIRSKITLNIILRFKLFD